MKFSLLQLVLTIISCSIFKIEAQNCFSNYEPFFNGTCMLPNDCTGAIINNKCAGNLQCCITDANINLSFANFVTKFEMQEILSLHNLRINYISKVLIGPSSNPTCFQKAFYFSQLAHESSKFLNSEELGNDFSKYDGRLGNVNPGDGYFNFIIIH